MSHTPFLSDSAHPATEGQPLSASPSSVASPFFSRQEYCAWRGCSTRTEARERVAGLGPPHLRFGNRVVYRRSDVEEWVAARTIRGAATATPPREPTSEHLQAA